jgi:hypothetical protein
MKTSARQPAQKKRRIESRIVGQHITDEPSTNAHEACYAIRTLVIVTVGGTAYGFTATFGPMPCPGLPGPFLPLLRSRHPVPRSAGLLPTHLTQSCGTYAVHAVHEKRRLLVLMETVEVRFHRFHSVTAATG